QRRSISVLHLLLPLPDHRRAGDALGRDDRSGTHRSDVVAGEHVAAAAHDARRLTAARRTGGLPVTTIAIWSNWPSTPTDCGAALPNDTLVLIKNESDLARASAAEVAFCGISLDRVRKLDRKSTRLNSSHDQISYAVFCLK